MERARHVEVQVLGDGTNVVHLYERECSMQRRRQKIVEEAPAPDLPDAVRQHMLESSVELARQCHYKGAGHGRVPVDAVSHEFFFIEMNTRIQVEHPVTEMVTGVDLVREQLLIAAGEPLRMRQEDVVFRGHAFEFRLNAEDPAKDSCPARAAGTPDWPGGPVGARRHRIRRRRRGPAVLRLAAGEDHRLGRDRGTSAIGRSRPRAATSSTIEGVKTTMPLLSAVLLGRN